MYRHHTGPASASENDRLELPSAVEFLRLLNKLTADSARRKEQHATRQSAREGIRVRIARRNDAVYIISSAARLAEMHPQTLRKYDREGLVSPSRTEGSRRMYSEADLYRLQVVRKLSEDLGLNLNGVGLVLELVQQMQGMLQVLQSSDEIETSHSVRAVAEQIKVLLRYLGVEQ